MCGLCGLCGFRSAQTYSRTRSTGGQYCNFGMQTGGTADTSVNIAVQISIMVKYIANKVWDEQAQSILAHVVEREASKPNGRSTKRSLKSQVEPETKHWNRKSQKIIINIQDPY